MQVFAALSLILVGLTIWIWSLLRLLRRKKPLTLSLLIAESSVPFLMVAWGLEKLQESGYLLPSTRGWQKFFSLLVALAWFSLAYAFFRASSSGHNKQ
ncbi:MAG TPA: hypothetical protein VFB38_11250 [Chthonomonadaceae bacterium]|nr:hypothetical protein [Chthonomonadaceae bacterium]